MIEMRKEPLVDNPLAPTKSVSVQSVSSVTQSDRIREAAKIILREAGEPVMQLDLKLRMESKGFTFMRRTLSI